MTEVSKRSPAAAPGQPQVLAHLAEIVKEPLRQLVAAVSDYIDIESAAGQVTRAERLRSIRRYQVTLFLERAPAACDDEWHADASVSVQHEDGQLARRGFQLGKVPKRWINHG